MELYSSVWHIFSALLVFLSGAAISMSVASRFRTSIVRTLVIYSWHTLFCMAYLWYSLTHPADSNAYYRAVVDGIPEFGIGTQGVYYLTALIVQGLDLSILGLFLVFNIFGVIGLLAFDAALRTATWGKRRSIQRLAALIIFMPSVSFWSSAVGKDPLSFMATGLALWAALDLRRRAPLMIFSIAIMLLVRPHMAVLMLVAFIVATLLDSKSRIGEKTLLSVITIGTAVFLIPFSLKYAGLTGVIDWDILINYIETRQLYNMQGSGGIDIASMNLPMQLITYMFRPFIFEAWSFLSLVASIENMILLYLFIAGSFIAGSRMLLDRGKKKYQESRVFMWLYSVMTLAILATTSANLGISLRQKWMFLPMLTFLFISIISKRKVKSPLVGSLSVYNVLVQKNTVDREKSIKIKEL
jgi:hypothetical protein